VDVDVDVDEPYLESLLLLLSVIIIFNWILIIFFLFSVFLPWVGRTDDVRI
jgi:hypothetical protein